MNTKELLCNASRAASSAKALRSAASLLLVVFFVQCIGVVGMMPRNEMEAGDDWMSALTGIHLPARGGSDGPEQKLSIEEREALVVQDTLAGFEAAGIKTQEDWDTLTEQNARALFYEPRSSDQMDQEIMARLNGAPEPAVNRDVAALVNEYRGYSEDFLGYLEDDLRKLPYEDLVQARFRFAASLAILEVYQEKNNPTTGMPPEFLDLMQEFNEEGRELVLAELDRRGQEGAN